jgi:hypothetical protein
MTNVLVYDDTLERLDAIANERDISIAEIVDALLDNGMEIIDSLFPLFDK